MTLKTFHRTRSVRDTDKIVNSRSDRDLYVGSPEIPSVWKSQRHDDVSPLEQDTGLQALGSAHAHDGVVKMERVELDSANELQEKVRPHGYRSSVSLGVFLAICAVLLGFFLLTEQAPAHHVNSSAPIIAIVGATGAGKSSLIELLEGRDSNGRKPSVGHNLESCTRNVTWYHATVNAQSVQLLDTPGFDDTALSDSEVLEAISLELAKMYTGSRSLNGLIYLYDISRPRLGGQSSKNLQLFQQLVGDESLKNVILATTHWSQWDKQHFERQSELTTKYWKRMTLHGSRIERHDGTRKSAISIVQPLISTPPTVIRIVNELVDQGLRWEDTAVGKSMSEALAKFQSKMKEELAAVTSYLRQLEEKRTAEAEQGERSRANLEQKYREAAEESDKRAMYTIAELKGQLKAQQEEQSVILRQQFIEAAREKEEYLKRLEDIARRQQTPKGKFNGDSFERCDAPYRLVKPSSTLVGSHPTDSSCS